MSIFRRSEEQISRPNTGDPATDMLEVLLRIEARLANIEAHTKRLDNLDARMRAIETAIKHI